MHAYQDTFKYVLSIIYQYTQEKIHVDLYQTSLQVLKSKHQNSVVATCVPSSSVESLWKTKKLAHPKALTPNPNHQKTYFYWWLDSYGLACLIKLSEMIWNEDLGGGFNPVEQH